MRYINAITITITFQPEPFLPSSLNLFSGFLFPNDLVAYYILLNMVLLLLGRTDLVVRKPTDITDVRDVLNTDNVKKLVIQTSAHSAKKQNRDIINCFVTLRFVALQWLK